jgi:hypothetical protein
MVEPGCCFCSPGSSIGWNSTHVLHGDGETDVVLHCDNCRGAKQEQFGAVLLCLLDCEPPSPEEDGSCVQALALPRALDCSASGIPEWTLCQTLLGL